jgi:hypothetical protein
MCGRRALDPIAHDLETGGAKKIQNRNERATLKQQLTSNCSVSPLSLLFGELKSSPFLRSQSTSVTDPILAYFPSLFCKEQRK